MNATLLSVSVFLLVAGMYAEWAGWRLSLGLLAAAIALLLIARMVQARELHDELMDALEGAEPAAAPRAITQSSPARSQST